MPRTRSGRGKGRCHQTATTFEHTNYHEASSSDDSRIDLLSTLSLILNHCSLPKRPRGGKSAGRPKKRRATSESCEHCGGCQNVCQNSTPKRKYTKKNKQQLEPAASTSGAAVLTIDSDEESQAEVTESHVNNIKKKVGGFFEALGSDDEEYKKAHIVKLPVRQKTEDFYTILSDSDDGLQSPISNLSKVKSDLTDTQQPIIPLDDSKDNNNLNSSQCFSKVDKVDELLAYADDVLNDRDIIDITEDSQTKAPMMSLDELKKKTDEILKEVASCGDALDDFLPKTKELGSTQAKEAPMCPVCFEPLGASNQAMATLCGHMFCEPCLKQVIRTTKKCPSCRKKLNKSKYHPVYI